VRGQKWFCLRAFAQNTENITKQTTSEEQDEV
jgi:hypothetical protein